MQVNDRYFHFPPFISISWEHVAALFLKESDLVIILAKGHSLTIPGLNPEQLKLIFYAHGQFLEGSSLHLKPNHLESKIMNNLPCLHGEQSKEPPAVRFGLGAIDNFGIAMQHNPSQSNAPNLPPEVLSKIAGIAKILAPEETALMPKPEPHCNCFHCQIAKAIHQTLDSLPSQETKVENEEEAVSEEDLKFEQWEINQVDNQLFTAVNKLDRQETYRVYLGEPVGCTCGKNGCEHLLAVLKS